MSSNIKGNMPFVLLTLVIVLVTLFSINQTHNNFCCNLNDANEDTTSFGASLFDPNRFQFNHFLWFNNRNRKLDVKINYLRLSDSEILMQTINNNNDSDISEWFNKFNNNSHNNVGFSGYYSDQLYFVGLLDKNDQFIRLGLFESNAENLELQREYMLPFSSELFNPSVAYYPLTYYDKHTHSVLFIEQTLTGDSEYERRVQTYGFSLSDDGLISNQTEVFDYDIPGFISSLDKTLYIMAIFPQTSSTTNAKSALPSSLAIVIVKHENNVKYCITFEAIIDDSCEPLNLKTLDNDSNGANSELNVTVAEELTESNATFITMAVIGSVVILLLVIGVIAYFYFTRFKKRKQSNESIGSNETACKI